MSYSDGSASVIDAVLSAQSGTVDNGAAYTTTMCPSPVARYASYSAGSPRTLTINSLDNTKQYRLRFYSTASNAGQFTQFIIGGVTKTITTNNNADTAIIFDNIAPTSGSIAVTIQRKAGTGGSFDYLNGFTILEKGTVSGSVQSAADSNYVYDAIGNLIKDKRERIDIIKWSVYGKILEINKTATGSDPVSKIAYTYDAAGNRISKLVIKTGADSTMTWYVRDAQGNVMGVYESKTMAGVNLKLNEHHVYGSSRLGIVSRDVIVSEPSVTGVSANLIGTTYLSNFERGKKFFELSNHLGNVLVTVSDKKLGHNAGNGQIDYYTADVVSANDYYPFGMGMVGRKYNAQNSSYRYGFNGKENDNEISGDGNQYDYGFRIYNPRLGRFLSTDPLCESYPWFTPYQFAGNSPILNIDIDGLEKKPTQPNTTDNSTESLQERAEAMVGKLDKLIKENRADIKKLKQIDSELGKLSKKVEQFGTKVVAQEKALADVKKDLTTHGTGLLNNYDQTINSLQVQIALSEGPNFTASASGDISLGAKVALEGNWGGVKVGGEANAFSTSLVSGSAGFNAAGESPGEFGATGSYFYKDGKQTFQQGVFIGVKIPALQDFGYTIGVNRTITDNGDGSPTSKTSFGFNVQAPVLRTAKAIENAKQFKNGIFSMPSTISPLKNKLTTMNIEKKFFGIDVGGKAALLLGVEVNLKFGYYYNSVNDLKK